MAPLSLWSLCDILKLRRRMIGVAPGACLRRHFDKGPHATVIPASISKAKIPRSLGRLKINDLYSLALISLSLASDKVCFNYEFRDPFFGGFIGRWLTKSRAVFVVKSASFRHMNVQLSIFPSIVTLGVSEKIVLYIFNTSYSSLFFLGFLLWLTYNMKNHPWIIN